MFHCSKPSLILRYPSIVVHYRVISLWQHVKDLTHTKQTATVGIRESSHFRLDHVGSPRQFHSNTIFILTIQNKEHFQILLARLHYSPKFGWTHQEIGNAGLSMRKCMAIASQWTPQRRWAEKNVLFCAVSKGPIRSIGHSGKSNSKLSNWNSCLSNTRKENGNRIAQHCLPSIYVWKIANTEFISRSVYRKIRHRWRSKSWTQFTEFSRLTRGGIWKILNYQSD